MKPRRPTPDYDSQAAKILHEKNRPTIEAVIRGISDEQRAREYISAEVAGDSRSWVVGLLNRRLEELTDDE